MNFTDEQLKRCLAKMLPDEVALKFNNHYFTEYRWNIKRGRMVLDTELLHLCWLVEENQLVAHQYQDYCELLYFVGNVSAPWQQRTIALAKVKGVEIV